MQGGAHGSFNPPIFSHVLKAPCEDAARARCEGENRGRPHEQWANSGDPRKAGRQRRPDHEADENGDEEQNRLEEEGRQ